MLFCITGLPGLSDSSLVYMASFSSCEQDHACDALRNGSKSRNVRVSRAKRATTASPGCKSLWSSWCQMCLSFKMTAAHSNPSTATYGPQAADAYATQSV